MRKCQARSSHIFSCCIQNCKWGHSGVPFPDFIWWDSRRIAHLVMRWTSRKVSQAFCLSKMMRGWFSYVLRSRKQQNIFLQLLLLKTVRYLLLLNSGHTNATTTKSNALLLSVQLLPALLTTSIDTYRNNSIVNNQLYYKYYRLLLFAVSSCTATVQSFQPKLLRMIGQVIALINAIGFSLLALISISSSLGIIAENAASIDKC